MACDENFQVLINLDVATKPCFTSFFTMKTSDMGERRVCFTSLSRASKIQNADATNRKRKLLSVCSFSEAPLLFSSDFDQ